MPSPPEGDIILELHGEGVLDVPLSERRIGPVSLAKEPLVVGRKRQEELHRRAVTKECLQFLSRDHFQISSSGNVLKLHALTSNPIWRDRDGVEPIELERGDVVTLALGDRILLGSGFDLSCATADEARRTLYWHLRGAP